MNIIPDKNNNKYHANNQKNRKFVDKGHKKRNVAITVLRQ